MGITAAHLVSFFLHFAADLLVIAIVAFMIYFRRHSRRDLLMAYTSFNVGLFLVMTVISVEETGLGVGFGLFAILSIIRIRSEEFSNTELAYAFVVLVIALVNAFGVAKAAPTTLDVIFVLLLNGVAVLVVYVMDHPRLLRRVGRQQITLDRIHPNDQSLRADLEHRLNVRVLDYAITHVDYVREITVLNVRYATEG
ncbi:MAG TPA: DUF4956 domain-containing protein [Herpetosiphonaceae bacterium]